MKIFTTIPGIKDFIAETKKNGASIGFVPTMGALHQGHISLIEKARRENDLVGCSIFVNPIQFNNPVDLEKYPRTFEEDSKMLINSGCDFLLYPDTHEMYPEPVTEKFEFGLIDKVLEGAHRPGHFNGVAVVVKKLFEIFDPDKAYFGLKDYQQLCIIKAMTEMLRLPVQIVSCPTVRENDGLAMSSRNVRLSPGERKIAPEIFRILREAKQMYPMASAPDIENWAKNEFAKFTQMNVEYFEIVDSESLQHFQNWADVEGAVACTAVFLGTVRLIDNLIIF